jgi:hypothetical protein
MKYHLIFSCLLTACIVGNLVGCGDKTDCVPVITVTSFDPSGRWTGEMVKQESDCGENSRGARFAFTHDVSLVCDQNGEASVELSNEDNLDLTSTSLNFLGGGSFTVSGSNSDSAVDISYDNYDGSSADVTEKIRNYSNGKIVCSELYKGRATRR